MKICINDGFIIGYSETRGTEVDAADWARIQDALNARPQPDDGCQVMLRADTLEWVQIPLPRDEDDPMPPEDDEAHAQELLNILLGGDEA